MGKTSHPPGFRFHPTDEELFMFYLKRKVMGKKIPPDVITELDIYKFVPQDLPDKSCLKTRDLEWYFFCPIERKYGVGDRWKRTTESGFWKTTGKDRKVESSNRTVGQIRTLIFHYGRASQRGGDRTDWVMHEYRLEDEDLAGKGIAQDAFVLCKIFQKSGRGPKNGAQYGAPFNEEEWDTEDEADDQIESLPCTCSSAPAIVLNDNQSSSILRGVVGHGDTLSGFPSCSGPSQTLPSADQVLPSVPDDDVPELQTEDEFLAMFDAFQDDDILDICVFNENDENEVCKPSHAQNVDDALHVEGNDIFEDLGDLPNLAEMNKTKISLDQWSFHDSFLELRDLDLPLNSPAEGSGSGFVLPGGVSMGSEHFDHQRNDFGVTYHASASIPSTPVLADRSYGFENQKDAFPEKCVGANVVEQGYLGYGSASHNKKRPEPDGGHGSQGQKRGKQQQTKSYSRLQQLIESIPNRPASAAERPGSSNELRKDTIITIMCPRKEAAPPLACWDGNFMFVLFLGLLSALMWLFIAAIIVKLGRCVWDLLLT